MSGKLLITNCRLFEAEEGIKSILIEEGLVSRIAETAAPDACGQVLDAGGRIAVPGFIDVHLQGAGGADVLDGTKAALETIARTCVRFGITAFLATTVYRPEGDNSHLELLAANVGNNFGGARLLGIHLEGPFISREKRGMILPECICTPSRTVLDGIRSITGDTLRIMTIAPELEGSLEVIQELVGSGTIASFGHSRATFAQTLKGIEAGISHVTHLFNAMTAFHHRHPGPLPAITGNEKVSVQVIPDGVHVHPAVLKFAWGLIGESRWITISDGMRALGLPDGKYTYNGVEYESKKGVARYSDGTLVGTALGLNQLLDRLPEFTRCSPASAVRTVSENPARLLGLETRKGAIAPGKDADLVVLEDDCSVWATIAGGKIVFRKESDFD